MRLMIIVSTSARGDWQTITSKKPSNLDIRALGQTTTGTRASVNMASSISKIGSVDPKSRFLDLSFRRPMMMQLFSKLRATSRIRLTSVEFQQMKPQLGRLRNGVLAVEA